MNSVTDNINTVLGAIDGYITICQDIDRDNGMSDTSSGPTSILTLTTLKILDTIDLSRLESILQLLLKHISYVKGLFLNVKDEGISFSQTLFQDALNNGALLYNGPHAAPYINLVYQYNYPNITMKAELDATNPNSSWYDRTTSQFVDNRTITNNVKLGFSFDGANLSYGTMFPVN